MKCSELYQQARGALKAGDRERALALFRQVAGECPGTSEADYAAVFARQLSVEPDYRFPEYGETETTHLHSLTSAMTPIYKYVFPALWIPGFGFGTLSLAIKGSPDTGLFLAGLIAGTAFILWYGVSLKFVELEGDHFVVSGFRRSARIPVREVDEITENVFINPPTVTIKFKRETVFGTRVRFMPPMRFTLVPFSRHPLIKELKAYVLKVQSGRHA